MWKHLDHSNIVPLRCITTISLQLISDWMPGGDLLDYIKKHPNADRLKLVSVPLAVFIPLSLLLPAIRCR